MTIQTINPATGQPLKTYAEMTTDAVDQIIEHTHAAWLVWRDISFGDRAAIMQRLIALMEERKQSYAELITQEMGKPITAALAEISKCQWVCRHYKDHAEAMLAPEMIATEMHKSYVCYQPLGVLFAIMPWNFPFWQVFRFAAPNIMAGNAILLSHAPINTGVALAIEALFRDAGFPANLFRTLIIDHPTAAHVIHHPLVKGVTLTGSQRAGKIIAVEAGNALKKCVLELGGNDPYLVLKDADLELAATACVKSRLANSGQVCIAAKRLIVVNEVYTEFLQKILTKIENYRMSDPMDAATDLGPIAREDLRMQVHQQVMKCVKMGATLICGGILPSTPGFFYPITVLANITSNMPAMQEEIFGPVISLIRVRDEEEAIRIANQTHFGLAASVFTRDMDRGEKIARDKIRAGTCYVNAVVSSDPRLPFGGVDASGYGRELGVEGLREFMNVKTIGLEK